MLLNFLGASQNVTGSCYLLEDKDTKILIDCGMFQEIGKTHLNLEDFRFNPKEIDALLLTHAHIDHSGLIPKLVKQGFKGPIYTTAATTTILTKILPDSAKIQKINAQRDGIPPLYSAIDVTQTLNQIIPIHFDTPHTISPNTTVTFRKASHILGAASIEIKTSGKTLCFSGDLGRKDSHILEGYGKYDPNVDIIVMESLYGNRDHEKIKNSLKKLTESINETINRNGNVIIPVFAIHRTETILYYLQQLLDTVQIPQDTKIFLDSPLASKVLDIYIKHPHLLNKKLNSLVDPFGVKGHNLHIVTTHKESKRLKRQKGAIILAGGGMVDGGRVLNHLNSFINDKKSSLLIVGFQAEGTLGRKLITCPEQITLNKKTRKVKIQIKEIYGFSAHAGQSDLSWWLRRYNKDMIKRVFLTHSLLEQSSTFQSLHEDYPIDIPELYSSYEI